MTEQLHRFEDGDETITVRTVKTSGGYYVAFDHRDTGVGLPVGLGLSSIGAIADLFAKLPAAASEREERDRQADRWDHRRELAR